MTTTSDSNGGLREELRGDAESLGATAKQRIHRELDTRKGAAVEQARSLSSALGSAADQIGPDQPSWLRSAFEQGAQTLQRLAETVEQKDTRQLGEEVRRLANQSPGTFLAGCALAGFAAARVFKAGGEGAATASNGSASQDSQTGQSFATGETSQTGQSSQSGTWDQSTGHAGGLSGQGSGENQSAFFTAAEQELTEARAGDGL